MDFEQSDQAMEEMKKNLEKTEQQMNEKTNQEERKNDILPQGNDQEKREFVGFTIRPSTRQKLKELVAYQNYRSNSRFIEDLIENLAKIYLPKK